MKFKEIAEAYEILGRRTKNVRQRFNTDTLLTIQILDLVVADSVSGFDGFGGFGSNGNFTLDSEVSLVVFFGGGGSRADRANMHAKG